MERSAALELCARSAIEVNRVYCLSIGDGPQLPWEEAPAWLREIAIALAQAVLDDNGPEQLHQLWEIVMLEAGWRYGPVESFRLKQHPSLVDYRELPREQQMKDELFHATVRAVAAVVGLTDRAS